MPRLEGSMVAIVTPMKDGGLDLRSLRELVEWHVAEGTDGIVPCGTTGEGATLTAAERAEVIRTVIEVARAPRPRGAARVRSPRTRSTHVSRRRATWTRSPSTSTSAALGREL